AALPPRDSINRRVLVVDDDETNLDLARHILQLSRLDVTVCQSGNEALDLYERARSNQSPFNVVVADLMMPGMSGTDLASRLVVTPNPPRLVCVTGRVAPTTLEMCAAAGFDVVVTKPYRMASLLLAVMGSSNTDSAKLATSAPSPAFRAPRFQTPYAAR
ncbi:MAG: response regulator, partial [Bacteroidota bacterium]